MRVILRGKTDWRGLCEKDDAGNTANHKLTRTVLQVTRAWRELTMESHTCPHGVTLEHSAKRVLSVLVPNEKPGES